MRIQYLLVFAALIFAGSMVGDSQENSTPQPLENGAAKARVDLRPFWNGDRVQGETILFVKQEASDAFVASGPLLFPVTEMIQASDSAGTTTYESGTDFLWEAGSNQIRIPKGSRIPVFEPKDLRRAPKSQRYQLEHRDGGDEIYFGGELEYAAMQTCFSYRYSGEHGWNEVPSAKPGELPRTVERIRAGKSLHLVVLGDSISYGLNASGLFHLPPDQPPYPELVRRWLADRMPQGEARMTNLSVGGMDSAWGLTQADRIVELKADLVVIAFGMNDAAGRPVESYATAIRQTIEKIQKGLPECEFILVAGMRGNADWIRLNQSLFDGYRDALAAMRAPNVALVDLTQLWSRMLEHKRDWDLTGNGVNHPNDFGHRLYASGIVAMIGTP